jgi:RNA polymerase sigma-70 factor (ECF subfamily)
MLALSEPTSRPRPPSLSGPRLASVHRLPAPRGAASLDDAALARAAAEGDPAAAGVLWDRFAALARGVLRRSLGPQHDVDDQVQEVFIRLFRQVGTLRDSTALRSFVIGITIRVAQTELRRRRMRRWLTLSDSGVLPETGEVLVDEDAREALSRLYAILDRVDDESRLVFVLRHIELLELTEVAAAIGISLATTKRRLAKVVARVRAMVGRDPILACYLVDTPEAEP